MTRSGYVDDLDPWDIIRWRGAVVSALRGARGRALLQALLTSLDALPEKRLIAHDLITPDGCCALGALAQRCGIDVADLDPEDSECVAARFGIAESLVREIVWVNDEEAGWPESPEGRPESPEGRFARVRKWVCEQLNYRDEKEGIVDASDPDQ